MELQKTTVEEQLRSFEDYIERGGGERAFLKPIFEEVRESINRVFEKDHTIDVFRIKELCGGIDLIVYELRQNSCGEEIIDHIQSIREMVWEEFHDDNAEYPEELWVGTKALSEELNVSSDTIRKLANMYKVKNPRWFRKYRAKIGASMAIYHPDLALLISRSVLSRRVPEGWIDIVQLAQKCNISLSKVRYAVAEIRAQHPYWCKRFTGTSGQFIEHYHPDFIAIIESRLSNVAPPDWLMNNTLARHLKVSGDKVKKFAEEQRQQHPEWFQRYLSSKSVKEYEYYHPDLVIHITSCVKSDLNLGRAPEGWYTSGGLGTLISQDNTKIASLANEKRTEHPEWFQRYLSSKNRPLEYYHPDLVTYIRERVATSKSLGTAPKGWSSASELASDLRSSTETIKAFANAKLLEHPEWFAVYLNRAGRKSTYYHPDLINLISQLSIPKNWRSCSHIAKQLYVTSQTVVSAAEEYRSDHPNWFRYEELCGKRRVQYYHPDLVTRVVKSLEQRQTAPAGWMTNWGLATQLQAGQRTVEKLAKAYSESHPEWFRYYIASNKRQQLHYHPSLIEKIIEKILQKETLGFAPNGWMTSLMLAEFLGVSATTIRNFVETYRKTHPEWFCVYIGGDSGNRKRTREYFHPDLIAITRRKFESVEKAPHGWETRYSLARRLKKAETSVIAIANKFRDQHLEWFCMYKDRSANIREYFHPDLVDIIENLLTHDEREEEETKKLENQLENLSQEIKEGSTPETREIWQLIGLFGGSHFIEILFLYHPQYRSLGVEKVRKIIGEYLGDFLVNIRPSFNISEGQTLPEVITPDLESALFAALKNDILSHCNKRKREGSKLVDLDLVLEYLASKEDQLNITPYLQRVKDQALQYYTYLFSELRKPNSMVDRITSDRAFPDLNQLVNIMELSYHKQLLIADEMGLGKSNSAISAKEFLGLKRAVVVMPASVRNAWAEYISDQVAEDGTQIGYFKPGQAPKVLLVNSPSDLCDISDYDYVLISQERLTEAYTQALLQSDFDYLIVDEVHKLKNLKGGKRSERIIQLARSIHDRDGYLALLSGTPVPNKVIDTALILRLLYPQRFADLSDQELIQKVIQGDLLELKSDLHIRTQMKELSNSIELPERLDLTISVELSGIESDIYEALLEEDEFTASEKITLLRRFCLDHQSLDVAPTMPSAKAMALSTVLREAMGTSGKAVVFVNDFITGIIRENGTARRTLLDDLGLPADVAVCVIHGEIPLEERHDIQDRLNNSDERMVLFVSGKTSDVGVSYTGATHVVHVNEPWTLFEKDQQVARTYRPGLTHPIETTTLRTIGSIESAQYEYMIKKYQVIQKIIRQIPLSEMEAHMISSDAAAGEVPEFNPQLAREYLSKIQRFNHIVGALKEKGEPELRKFLEEHAEMYAEAYRMLGTRSYQGNNARVTSSLLHKMMKERKQDKSTVRILDIGSGPKTLQSRSLSGMKPNILSLDLNPRHFEGMEGSDFIVGSYLDMPVESGSMDYCNLSFAFHYTRLVKRHNDYERVQLLAEMNRVLKIGGRSVISSIYSIAMKNMELFEQAIEILGFRLVRGYTGEAKSGEHYSAHFLTLEKVEDTELLDGKVNMEAIVPHFNNGLFRGLKFQQRKKKKLRKQSTMVDDFCFNGTVYPVQFNEEDQVVRNEEKAIHELVQGLVEQYGSANDIPLKALEENNLIRWRYKNGTCRLARKLTSASGMIVY